jgi:hypothetical protein
MTNIANTYINALLADAAYVNLLPEPLNSSGNQSLLGSRMTPTLAAYIAGNRGNRGNRGEIGVRLQLSQCEISSE